MKRLHNEFWTRYRHSVGSHNGKGLTRGQALRLFELTEEASAVEIRKRGVSWLCAGIPIEKMAMPNVFGSYVKRGMCSDETL